MKRLARPPSGPARVVATIGVAAGALAGTAAPGNPLTASCPDTTLPAPVQPPRACAPLPRDLDTAKNPRHFFLSEVGGCPALPCLLEQISASGGRHANATLVVDQACTLTETLTLPDRFTLAGVGIDGEGMLAFDLPHGTAAIRLAAAAGAPIRHAAIRDLKLQNLRCCGQVGIDVSNGTFVQVERVRVQGFGAGIAGREASSIDVAHSSFSDNCTNAVLGDDSTAWRLRDSTFSRAVRHGILASRTARGHVVSGARIESNGGPGVALLGDMNVIESSWFEGNGGEKLTAINFAGSVNRAFGNLLSSQLVLDSGTDNQWCLNMTFEPHPQHLNGCNVPPMKP